MISKATAAVCAALAIALGDGSRWKHNFPPLTKTFP